MSVVRGRLIRLILAVAHIRIWKIYEDCDRTVGSSIREGSRGNLFVVRTRCRA